MPETPGAVGTPAPAREKLRPADILRGPSFRQIAGGLLVVETLRFVQVHGDPMRAWADA